MLNINLHKYSVLDKKIINKIERRQCKTKFLLQRFYQDKI